MTDHKHKQPMRAHRIYENAAALGSCEAERDRLKATVADLLVALRNMTALANNMRGTIEEGNFVTRYEIPFGYFNAAYIAMERAESQ